MIKFHGKALKQFEASPGKLSSICQFAWAFKFIANVASSGQFVDTESFNTLRK